MLVISISGTTGGLTSAVAMKSGPLHQRDWLMSPLAPKPIEEKSAGLSTHGQYFQSFISVDSLISFTRC